MPDLIVARRRWLVAFAMCIGLVLASMTWVDRPVADYVHVHLSHSALFELTNRALGMAHIGLILLFGVLFAAGFRRIGGDATPVSWATPLTMAWSAMWALSTIVVLKVAIGRSSPFPEYVESRIYEFRPLHGAGSFEAFPSGFAGIAAALVGVAWVLVPRLRAAWGAILAAVAIALVLTNNHWVSDVIGGTFLGASIGWMTVLISPSSVQADQGTGPR